MPILYLLFAFLLVMFVPAAFALRVAAKAKWWQEGVELAQYGVETTGRVVEKRQVRSRGSASSWIRYEYTDRFGRTHRSRRNLVTPDAWASHVEGGPIAVVYSRRRPAVSLPRFLVQQEARRGTPPTAQP